MFMCKGGCNINAVKGMFFRFFLVSLLGLMIAACHKPSDAMGGSDVVDRIPAEDCASNTYLQKYDCSVSRIRQAANRGDPDAQYALAYIYYYGIGTAQDKQAAKLWMNRAAAQGQPLAKTADDLLATEPYTMDANTYGGSNPGSSNLGEIDRAHLNQGGSSQYGGSSYYRSNNSNSSGHSKSHNNRITSQNIYRDTQIQQPKKNSTQSAYGRSNSKNSTKKTKGENALPPRSKSYPKPKKKPRPADLPTYDSLPSLHELNTRLPDKSIDDVLPNYGKQQNGNKAVIKSLQRSNPPVSGSMPPSSQDSSSSPPKKSAIPEPLTQNEDGISSSQPRQISAENKQPTVGEEGHSLATGEQVALNVSQTHYTLQLMGGTNLAVIKKFIASHHLDKKVQYYSAQLNHETWYMVIYGDYPNMETAHAAMEEMPDYLRALHPWVKSYRTVHDEIRFHEMIS